MYLWPLTARSTTECWLLVAYLARGVVVDLLVETPGLLEAIYPGLLHVVVADQGDPPALGGLGALEDGGGQGAPAV